MPSLTKEGLIAGAKQAAQDGLSFDAYCELIANVIISGQTVEQVKALLKSHGLDVYFGPERHQMVVSEIQALYRDENDLFRTVRKRIYEEWDAAREQWNLKKVEYIFCEPELPIGSDAIELSVEHRHGWLIPPAWEFRSEVRVYERKPIEDVQETVYNHDSEVQLLDGESPIIREE